MIVAILDVGMHEIFTGEIAWCDLSPFSLHMKTYEFIEKSKNWPNFEGKMMVWSETAMCGRAIASVS